MIQGRSNPLACRLNLSFKGSSSLNQEMKRDILLSLFCLFPIKYSFNSQKNKNKKYTTVCMLAHNYYSVYLEVMLTAVYPVKHPQSSFKQHISSCVQYFQKIGTHKHHSTQAGLRIYSLY